MRILADESVVGPLIGALRRAGYDLISVAETTPGAPDGKVLELAVSSGCLLLTEDRDFGALVYRDSQPNPGVVFIRNFPESAHELKIARVLATFNQFGDSLIGDFTVIEPHVIRRASAS